MLLYRAVFIRGVAAGGGDEAVA